MRTVTDGDQLETAPMEEDNNNGDVTASSANQNIQASSESATVTNDLVSPQTDNPMSASDISTADALENNSIIDTVSDLLSQPVMEETASTASSAVTLETLSEDAVSVSGVSVIGGQNHHSINHPLLTPASPRSVTTVSMSASGKSIVNNTLLFILKLRKRAIDLNVCNAYSLVNKN